MYTLVVYDYRPMLLFVGAHACWVGRWIRGLIDSKSFIDDQLPWFSTYIVRGEREGEGGERWRVREGSRQIIELTI